MALLDIYFDVARKKLIRALTDNTEVSLPAARRLRYAYGRGASDSELVTRYKVDPIMGGTGMNVNFVKLVPAEKAS